MAERLIRRGIAEQLQKEIDRSQYRIELALSVVDYEAASLDQAYLDGLVEAVEIVLRGYSERTD